MLKKITRYIRRFLYSFRKPVMINGYKTADGRYLSRVRISSSTFIDYPNNLHLSDNIFIGHHNFIEASNSITIAEGCQITNFVSITSHSSHQSIRLYGNNYAGAEMIGYIKGKVEIGAFTFVGPHVTIMPNTFIGKGCVVASHSYVEGVFPDFSIIAGVPAKVIGSVTERDSALLEQYPELKKTYMK